MQPSPQDRLSSENKSDIIVKSNVLDCVLPTLFSVDPSQLMKMQDAIYVKLSELLRQRSSEGLSIRWSFVPTLPTGRSTGKCLALEFGCSDHYFAVNLCSFKDDQSNTFQLIDRRIFMLTSAIRRAHMHQFCDFVAACLKRMLEDNSVHSSIGNPIHMGVAAGFDVRVKAQRSPASATAISCGKDYEMVGFIGHDFVPQFHAAFQRANIHVQIVTVINDTVSVLLAGIHQVSRAPNAGSDCSIGVVCHRSGCNVAFLETDRDFLDTCGSDGQHLLRRPRGSGFCAVANTEAGYWIGADGELDAFTNKIERLVARRKRAANSGCPGVRLEYITSGAWYPLTLGQSLHLLRSINVLALDVAEDWCPGDSACFEIFTHCDQWRSGRGRHQERDEAEGLAAKLRPLLGARQLSVIDALIVADVCQAIVSRTAEVLAAALMVVAERAYGKALPKTVVIAYDGSLFTSVSQLKLLLESSLRKLVSDKAQVLLLKCDVGFGCAVTALSAGTIGQSRITG